MKKQTNHFWYVPKNCVLMWHKMQIFFGYYSPNWNLPCLYSQFLSGNFCTTWLSPISTCITLSRNHKLLKNHTVYSSSIWIVCWICCRSMVQRSLLTKSIFNNVTIKQRWNNFRMQFFNATSSRVSMIRRLVYLLLAVSFWQTSFSQDLNQLYEILSLINLSSHIFFTGLTSVKNSTRILVCSRKIGWHHLMPPVQLHHKETSCKFSSNATYQH